MRELNYYLNMAKQNVEIMTVDEMIEEIWEDAKTDISEELYNMDEYDLFVIIHEYAYSIHRMEEFDDVYSHLSPSEVLRELYDIDLDDSYFNEDTGESSSDAMYLAEFTYESLAQEIIDDAGSYNDEIADIIRKADYIECEIREYFRNIERKKELARKLLEERLQDDSNVDEVISVLWNN